MQGARTIYVSESILCCIELLDTPSDVPLLLRMRSDLGFGCKEL